MTSFLVEKGATVINTFWLGNYIRANVSEEVLYEVSKRFGIWVLTVLWYVFAL